MWTLSVFVTFAGTMAAPVCSDCKYDKHRLQTAVIGLINFLCFCQDEGSNDEDDAMVTGGGASGSDNEDCRRADSDSEGEGPGGRDDKSDSEAEAPRPADSDDEDGSSSVKRRVSASEEEESPPEKRRTSGSDNEASSPLKHGASDNEEGASPPPKRRGSSSDVEERPKAAAESDSDNEDAKAAASPERRSNADSDSDTETPARRKAAQIDSDEEEKREEEGGGEKWKGVMQSDSEEEEEEGRRKTAAGSDGEQQEEEERQQRGDSDEDDEKPGTRVKFRRNTKSVSKERARKHQEKEKTLLSYWWKNELMCLFCCRKMIADIFGESGDEEEFTGFNQEDLEGDGKAKQKVQAEEESDSDEGVDRSGQDMMSDFDIMLARRKAMNSKKRRHRDGGTFISDADDVVNAMITKMNEAAEEDRALNSQKKPALKKLMLLPQVVMHLKKQDLKETFIDSGVMSAIKEWISPLPDKSLPALRIREELLRILQELPSVSQETLKHSGIGRAVMFLYKHPKESRANKDLALKLINEWSRPIFGLTSNYKGMTREERQQRDLDQQMPQRRRLSSGGQTPRRDLEKQLTGEEKALRPGDPGFCARARVPMPSNKDYVVRPKWNVEGDSSRSGCKKAISLLEKHKRRFAEQRKLGRPQGAVKISIEGNRMPL
uniref:TFIIS N-terminal domain-containing protein n=1 Tax=Pundamilia nyererei TaxID=303518 RepID=A0A3B4FMS2_9CICH